jgi:hypothetical protein
VSEDYRDPLAAALSRIDGLERENAALKNEQGARPATVAELEAELLHLDAEWQASKACKDAARVDASRTLMHGARVLSLVTFLLVLAMVLNGRRVVAGAVGAISLATVIWIAERQRARVASDRDLHVKRRDRLARQIAALRSQQPAVRVAAELDAGDDEAIVPAGARREGLR